MPARLSLFVAFGISLSLLLPPAHSVVAKVEGHAGGESILLPHAIVGDAGSGQFGLLISTQETMNCEIDHKRFAETEGTFLEVLLPSAKGAFRIKKPPRDIRSSARAVLHWSVDGKTRGILVDKGWVRIETLERDEEGRATRIAGKLHLEAGDAQLDGSFSAPYCGPIDL